MGQALANGNVEIADRVAADLKPSTSLKSANGPSTGRKPWARAATIIRAIG